MNKTLRWLVFGAAFMGMGISMPSCPGQQALQQQVDTLQTANVDLKNQIKGLDSQVKSMTNDMAQVKQLLSQMTNVIQAQRQALETLDTTVKNLAAHPAPQTKSVAKSAGKGTKKGATSLPKALKKSH